MWRSIGVNFEMDVFISVSTQFTIKNILTLDQELVQLITKRGEHMNLRLSSDQQVCGLTEGFLACWLHCQTDMLRHVRRHHKCWTRLDPHSQVEAEWRFQLGL